MCIIMQQTLPVVTRWFTFIIERNSLKMLVMLKYVGKLYKLSLQKELQTCMTNRVFGQTS